MGRVSHEDIAFPYDPRMDSFDRETIRRARLNVCANAKDLGEATTLLRMLGLVE